MNQPIRIQIMVYNQLIAEVIGSSEYCDSIWAKWCALRYKRNKELGCAVSTGAQFNRPWNIPVGSILVKS